MRWNDFFPSKSSEPAKTDTGKGKNDLNPRPGPGKKGNEIGKGAPEPGPVTDITVLTANVFLKSEGNEPILHYKFTLRFPESAVKQNGKYIFTMSVGGNIVRVPLSRVIHNLQSSMGDARIPGGFKLPPTVKVWVDQEVAGGEPKKVSGVVEVPIKSENANPEQGRSGRAPQRTETETVGHSTAPTAHHRASNRFAWQGIDRRASRWLA
jgi:hypothetical protein